MTAAAIHELAEQWRRPGYTPSDTEKQLVADVLDHIADDIDSQERFSAANPERGEAWAWALYGAHAVEIAEAAGVMAR